MMYHCYKLNNSKTEHISHIAWERLSVSNIVSCHGYCCRSCLIWCQLLLKRSTCKEASLDFSVFHTRCFLLIDVVSSFIASVFFLCESNSFCSCSSLSWKPTLHAAVRTLCLFYRMILHFGHFRCEFFRAFRSLFFSEFYPLLVSASTIWHICGCDSAVVFNIFNIFTVVIFLVWFSIEMLMVQRQRSCR